MSSIKAFSHSKPFLTAVIVAAGSASRMKRDKITMPIDGIPCICRTLLAFQQAETVSEIVVVTREDLIPVIDGYAREYGITKYSRSVTGGKCRQDSAARGVAAASENCGFVAVHDGARPLITPAEIDGVNGEAFSCGCAVCGVMVKDTIKVINGEDFVESTPDRSSLVAVSTPQTFSRAIYREMTDRFSNEFERFTDDSGMAEELGYKVKIYKCSYSNIKITTPEDLFVAEQLLKK